MLFVKRLIIRAIAVMTVVIFSLAMFSGCGKVGGGNGSAGLSGADQTSYPLKSDVTLKFWLYNGAPINNLTDKSQYPWYKEWQKRTGVNFKFIFPTIGQEAQQFNIMLASGELPDIIEYPFYNSFPGGPDKAINDGYVVNVNTLIDKYAPNYKKFLSNNPEYNKILKTDSGNILGFGETVEPGYVNKMLSVSGYVIRKDWLDELGLAIPTTIDEWYTVLKAFKDKKGVEAPLCISADFLGRGFSGAFGAPFGAFVDNGTVKLGYFEPGYKDFLSTLKKWYAEGLVDKNFASLDGKMIDFNMTSGKSGLAFGFIGANMGTWIKAGTAKNPKYDLVALPYPTINKGDKARFASFGQPVYDLCIAISATSKYKELAARVLDYGYSEEGHMFFNFGVENVDYKMENGYPKYTDKILKNPDNLSISQAMLLYTRANTSQPGWQDHRYLEQYYQLPQQKNALNTWCEVDYQKTTLPKLTYTPEESNEIAKITSDFNTYNGEMYLKFVLGQESLDNFDKYIERAKKIGIQKSIDIQQKALERYNKR